MPANAKEGTYRYGKGRVFVLRHDPKEYVLQAGGDKPLTNCLRKAYGKNLQEKNHFTLRREQYLLSAVLEESVSNEPLHLKGLFINLFDPTLPILTEKIVQPGEQSFLVDINKVKNQNTPQVLAAASRQYNEVRTATSYSFTAKSPANTTNVMRILLPCAPKKISVSVESNSQWDEPSHTLLLQFENSPDGVNVKLEY